MRFVHIDENYYKAIKNTKNNTLFELKSRPLVGIVLHFNGFNYFAPLTSADKSWDKVNSQTSIKLFILKKDNSLQKLGVVRLNNMLPVPEKCIIHFDINKITDTSYKNLLQQQQQLIVKHRERIHEKAYKIRCHQNIFIKNLCSDFNLLESFCKQWDESNK